MEPRSLLLGRKVFQKLQIEVVLICVENFELALESFERVEGLIFAVAKPMILGLEKFRHLLPGLRVLLERVLKHHPEMFLLLDALSDPPLLVLDVINVQQSLLFDPIRYFDVFGLDHFDALRFKI